MGWIVVFLLVVVVIWLLRRVKRNKRRRFIEQFQYRDALKAKVLEKYPHLDDDQLRLVFKGLTQYFLICLQAGKKPVAMPSQVVDVAWHEFILYTRAYQKFCQQGLGRFLHHTPTEAMSSRTIASEGIKRAWRLSCWQESINPKGPERLPLLFAMDSQLQIKDGFYYSRNCKQGSGSGGTAGDYCAGHIGCSSGCAGDSGSTSDSGGFFGGDSDGGSGCGSGCGGD